ncbi:hypothetical protein [Geothrix oryzisoli]|uniref:hypothetical protein n=1 Tax=Geothrix oryzisoli TaxID=2922721 RepID=UPI001FAC770F|nr:hypothetical protein [Geothrix oryzisoli]
MRFRSYSIATVALVSVFPLAAPLQACCDDFWSCVGAVASGGLTCAVESLVNSIRTLIQNVSRLASTLGQQAADVVNLAKSELNGAAADLRNLAGQAEGDFNAAAQLAQSVINEASRPQLVAPHVAPVAIAPAGAAATRAGTSGALAQPPGTRPAPATPAPRPGGTGTAVRLDQLPADPQEVVDALRRAKDAIDALRPDITQPINQVRQFATQAEQQAVAAASSAGNIAQTALLAPLQTLGNMLTDLVNHPEHIFDPSRIVDDAITQITTQTITIMTQVHDAVMQQAKATLDQAQRPIQDALDRAAVAKKIADAMQKVQRSRTKASCDALNSLIPRQRLDVRAFVTHVAGAAPAPGILALNLNQHKTMALAPFNRTVASRLTARTAGTQMAAKLKGPWQDFKRLQAAPPKVDPAAKPRIDAEISQRFAGKSGAAAEAEKRALLAEARTRFAKDPALLRKVEAMLDGDPVIRGHLGGPHGPAVREQ